MPPPRDPTDLALSTPLREIIEEAEDIAYGAGQVPSSLHLLLAFFTSKNPAERFLREQGIDEDRILARVAPDVAEPRGAVRHVMQRAAQVAASCGSRSVEGLHVVVGMTRAPESAASQALSTIGVLPVQLRTRALERLTQPGPEWVEPRHESPRRPPGRKLTHAELEAGRAAAVDWSPPMLKPAPKTARRDPPPGGWRGPKAELSELGAGVREQVSLLPALVDEDIESARPALPAPKKTGAGAPPALPRDPGSAWELPASDFPWLTSLGRNLSVEAARGELDPVIGRDDILDRLADVLGKRRANNACLVGEPGVGKTAIVEGLAVRWAQGSTAERERIVIGLDAGRLLVGTHLRGSFSERLEGLKDEVKRAEGKVLVFFDELHTLVGAGALGDGPLDAANELKTALARGELPCVGATTPDEHRRHIAKDAALSRRFEPILVPEPSPEEAERILGRALPAYAEHHRVGYTPEAVRAAVHLSVRFLPEQHLPDKAVALLDLAGSRVARAGGTEVDVDAIARLVSERAGVPVERLLSSDRQRLLGLEDELARRIIGHAPALARIANVVRRHAAGFGSHRPQGSFLLVGPTGVGKTETAKALAELLYGHRDRLVRFDLSELSEAHGVARLVGAPPGYVGHDSGGQLTEAIRKQPGSVILFDEIERAHGDVLELLLQILDDGRLTDGHGRTVGFSESLVLMSSNLGADRIGSAERKLGFDAAPPPQNSDEERVLDAARRALSPELWGRIDEKLYFGPLGREDVRRVAKLLVAQSSARLHAERGISFDIDGAGLDALLELGGYEPSLGARPLRRALTQLVESPIASRILEGKLHAGEHVRIGRRAGRGLVFRVGSERQSLSQRPGAC